MKSNFIKLEENELSFFTPEKIRVSVKLSDIISLSIVPSGRWGGIIGGTIFDIILICFFFASRQDSLENGKEISYLTIYFAIAVSAVFGFMFLKSTKTEKFLLIGSKGSPSYKVDCYDENLEN